MEPVHIEFRWDRVLSLTQLSVDEASGVAFHRSEFIEPLMNVDQNIAARPRVGRRATARPEILSGRERLYQSRMNANKRDWNLSRWNSTHPLPHGHGSVSGVLGAL